MKFLHRKKRSKKKEETAVVSKEDPVKKECSDSSSHNEVIKCLCCGSLQQVIQDRRKFKCNICQCSNSMVRRSALNCNSAKISISNNQLLASARQLEQHIKNCKQDNGDCRLVTQYLMNCFREEDVLERSFRDLQNGLFINHSELDHFYGLLFQLPSRKPLYRMLYACNDLLSKPSHRVENFRWIFIILANPIIRTSLIVKNDNNKFNAFDIRAIAYEITKKCLGYLSNIMDSPKYKIYAQYLKQLDRERFLSYVEVVNLYLTYQLRRIYETSLKENKICKLPSETQPPVNQQNNLNPTNPNNEESTNLPVIPTSLATNNESNVLNNSGNNINDVNNETIDVFVINQNHNIAEANTVALQTTQINNVHSESTNVNQANNNIEPSTLQFPMKYGTDMKNPKGSQIVIKPQQYQKKWQLRTATRLMSILKIVNEKRPNNSKLLTSDFYNLLLDFIDYKFDFHNSHKAQTRNNISNILHFDNHKLLDFAFSDYPFLLSLGLKISILGFETRRTMEYQAELAFLNSIDKHKFVPVYFKVRVRRKFLVLDSFIAIKEQQNNLLKALRVEFVGELGIDAGGLRKEWFLLLSKELFKKEISLFNYIEESGFSWFTINKANCKKHTEYNKMEKLYFLTGVVLGLALYNGIILDLNFPNLFYKKICNEQVTFDDFMELYPEVGSNLKKLLEYEEEDFASIFGLTFETTVKVKDKRDGYKLESVELCEGGANKVVTRENKREYINLWIHYYLNESILCQFQQFMSGFNKVFQDCKSIKLFDSEELKRLLCGDQYVNKPYDFNMLRSVTKYTNGFDNKSTVVEWFWEIVSNWEPKLQSRFLQFVTGSNKIPATGMSTLNFKISRVKSEENNLLPIAHTCFNELALCEYQSKDKLESKLFTAITESKGFEFK